MGCGALRPRPELRRFVLPSASHGVAATVVLDSSRVAPGRGAYSCDAACAARAVQRKAFHRAFKRTVQIPPDLLESMNSG